MHEGAPIYMAHADTGGHIFRRVLIESGFKLASCLIWRKNSLVLSRGDYHWQHEPILYGWKPGSAHRWYGDRDKTTILEFDDPPFAQVADDQWQISLGERTLLVRGKGLTVQAVRGSVLLEEKPSVNREHPTMKPTPLVARMLANSTRPGHRVLDMFAGSGSTLIACESRMLIGYMLELEPRYVDVIVTRWQNLTGGKATLGSGRTFDQIAAGRKRGE
jgi:DNA modification methylase